MSNKKKLKKMKRLIIIRSLRVALALAILSVSVELTFFHSGWFFILLLVGIFFVDTADSMLVWRLKRNTIAQMNESLSYVYLAVSVIAICWCVYEITSANLPLLGEPYSLMRILYPIMIAAFSFRYFAIVLRVMAIMARYNKKDEDTSG